MRTVVLTMGHLHLPVDERHFGVLPEAQDGGVTRNKLIIIHGKSSQDIRGQVTRKKIGILPIPALATVPASSNQTTL